MFPGCKHFHIYKVTDLIKELELQTNMSHEHIIENYYTIQRVLHQVFAELQQEVETIEADIEKVMVER